MDPKYVSLPLNLFGFDLAGSYNGMLRKNEHQKYIYVQLGGIAGDRDLLLNAMKLVGLEGLEWTRQKNVNGMRSSCVMDGEKASVNWKIVELNVPCEFKPTGFGFRIHAKKQKIAFVVLGCATTMKEGAKITMEETRMSWGLKPGNFEQHVTLYEAAFSPELTTLFNR